MSNEEMGGKYDTVTGHLDLILDRRRRNVTIL
jgi:hypothetical protein